MLEEHFTRALRVSFDSIIDMESRDLIVESKTG